MTVARYVRLRERGQVAPDPVRRDQILDPYLAKLEEWVERSHGRVRADVAHEKLCALGFDGSERTTRRTAADIKRAYAAGHRRVFRPWIPEPGMWFQFDWGKGPVIAGRDTLLWCAWLAWSRYRVIIPTWGRLGRTPVLPAEARLLRVRRQRTQPGRPSPVCRCLRAGLCLGQPGDLRCAMVGDGGHRAAGRVGRRVERRGTVFRRYRVRRGAAWHSARRDAPSAPSVGRPGPRRAPCTWAAWPLRRARPAVPPLPGAAGLR